jgi:hypothetical protein
MITIHSQGNCAYTTPMNPCQGPNGESMTWEGNYSIPIIRLLQFGMDAKTQSQATSVNPTTGGLEIQTTVYHAIPIAVPTPSGPNGYITIVCTASFSVVVIIANILVLTCIHVLIGIIHYTCKWMANNNW